MVWEILEEGMNQWSDEPAIYYWDSEEEENGRD